MGNDYFKIDGVTGRYAARLLRDALEGSVLYQQIVEETMQQIGGKGAPFPLNTGISKEDFQDFVRKAIKSNLEDVANRLEQGGYILTPEQLERLLESDTDVGSGSES